MQMDSPLSRRRLLATSLSVGGVSALTSCRLFQPTPFTAERAGETEHFYWRLSPLSPYIDSQRGDLAFGYDQGHILTSDDCARTWGHQMRFPDTGRITFSQILGNGNILFATANSLYLTDTALSFLRHVTVQDQAGDDYLPHTPLDPSKPGWYFHPLDGEHCFDVNGREMLLWGNYCNVIGGAVPVNLYYSTDHGRTVKLAYAFGISPRWQQRGAGPDDLLGNPDNPLIARHIHSVAYNPAEDAYYCCTGDRDEPVNGQLQHECHWLRGTYDWEADAWDWRAIVSDSMNTRYKSGGINFVDGRLYWCSDANGPEPHDRGIFACDPADLARPDRHEMLFHPEYEIANMLIEDGVILSGHYTPASPYNVGIIYSPDMGRTWAQYDLSEIGRYSPVRLHRKNSAGWFRLDLRQRWIERGRVMFIKPK